MPLGLQRIIRCRCRLYLYLACFYLKRLFGVWRESHYTGHGKGRGHIGFCDLLKVIYKFFFIHHLHGFKECSVIQFYEPELVGVPVVADPSPYQYLLSVIVFCVSEKFS